MEYSAPQIAGRDEPFRSPIREHLKGHTQGLEDLAITSSIIRRRRGLIAAIGFSCLRGGLAQPKSSQMGDLLRHSLHCRAAA